jgi:hypothetical protein
MIEKKVITKNVIEESLDKYADNFFGGFYGFLKEKHPQLRDIIG